MPFPESMKRRNLLRDYVTEPNILLVGCPAWPPPRRPDGSCGVCGGAIRREDTGTSCLWCGADHPGRAARIRGAQIGIGAEDRAEKGVRKLRDDLRRRVKQEPEMTERFKRRMWNGYGVSLLREHPDVTDLVHEARAWMREIGMVPDFSLPLVRRGRGDDALDHATRRNVDVDEQAAHRHADLRTAGSDLPAALPASRREHPQLPDLRTAGSTP